MGRSFAMPGMPDPRFAHSVIYLCAHSADGAMGLIVNRPADSVTFPAVVDQLGIRPTPGCNDTPVHVGGPVEANRGFVLHSCDYRLESTLVIDENFALTATVDVLRAGLRVEEVPVALRHRATGRDLAGQLHRAKQLRDVTRALAARGLVQSGIDQVRANGLSSLLRRDRGR